MLRPQTQFKKTLRRYSRSSLSLMTLALLGLTAVLAAGLIRSVESKSGATAGVGSEGFARRTRELNRRQPNRLMATQPGSERSFATAVAPLVTITVDRTDDNPLALACTPAPNDCSLRGAIIQANTIPGTTIMVPAGTYQLTIDGSAETGFCTDATSGDLDIIGNNTTIIGAGASTTIIQQTQPNDRVMCVDANLDGGFTFNITGVTITGGKETFGVGGGGILSGNGGDTTTVQDCILSGNQASGSGSPIGGGLANVGGSVILTGTSFDSNTSTGGGGGVYFGGTPGAGTLSVSNCAFTTNTSSSGNGGGLLATQGGGYTVSGTSFTGNKSQGSNGQGGGIFNESGTMSVTTTSLSGNQVTSATGMGGGIANSNSGIIVANFNRIAGNLANTGSGASNNGGSANFNDDWWGCNGGPGSSGGCSSAANSLSGATLASWLQLRHVASPNTICVNGTSTLTADIKGRSVGAALTIELNGLPAFPIPPATIFSNAVRGSISAASTQFVNGVATATFTGTSAGAGGADATADSQTVNASITINENTTSALANQAVCAGGTATFSTTASGSGPFSFVWKKGATVLNNGDLGGRVTITSGANTSSLSISNVQASDAGTYTVEATGSCSTATQSATLTINAATTATTPADQTVCQGTNASFSTTASGTGPFHYAWTVDGSAFDGDNSSISVPTGSLSVGNHPVSVTVTGACGSDTKNATLTVQAGTTTSDPPDQTVCQGASANFSTTAGGTGPFHYAWTLDGSPFNGDNASISVPTGSLSVGNHTVAVTTTGACGSASQSATLTVQATTATSDPADQTVCQGATAGFSTSASGTGPFHFAWTLDGSPFNGDNTSISVDTTSLSVGNHTVAVTTSGTCGSASQSATLTVQATTATSDPADQTVCPGTNANFATTASGTGPFHYAWTLDGSPFNGDNPSISVPTGSLSVGNHTVAVTTTDTCGSASQSATLTVQPGTTTSDPADQTVCAGTNANFSTTASGTGSFHYAWTLDGSPFNGDNPSISVPTGSLSVGNHTVAVTTTGTCGSASQSATLTVQPGTTTTDPADQTVCPGTNASFATTASGTGPFNYAWTLDGSPFNGDSPSISVPTGSLSTGNHTVSVTTTGSCGSASQTATLTVRQNTSTSDPADQNVCQGGTAVFSTTASGTGPFSFVWKQGATVINNGDRGGRVTIVNGSSSSMLTITNVQASDFGTYNIETTGSCNTATQSATLAVNNTPPSITLNGQNIELWPPNHTYHTITVGNLVASASSCDGTVNINSVVIDHVTSDETENGNGDGNTYNDIVISCNRKSVQLRSERDGGGDGRVYTIYFKVTDGLGHSTTVTAKVTVPHSQNGTSAIDSGPHYTVSSATCP